MRGVQKQGIGLGTQRVVLVLLAGLAALLLTTSEARSLGIQSLAAQPAKTQAGSHENFYLHVGVTDSSDDLKDLRVHLPAGLLGNPRAVPRCSLDQFAADICPAGTQVGQTTVSVTTTVLIVPVDLDAPGVAEWRKSTQGCTRKENPDLADRISRCVGQSRQAQRQSKGPLAV